MKHILIIDDDKSMLDVYGIYFEEKADEYEIELFQDARLGYRRMGKKDFDLVILDMLMEPMEGEMFLCSMLDDADKRDIPILVVSVLDPSSMDHLKKLGHVEFLKKPIAKEKLFEKIEETLLKYRGK